MRKQQTLCAILLALSLVLGQTTLAADVPAVGLRLDGLEVQLGHSLSAEAGVVMAPLDDLCGMLGIVVTAAADNTLSTSLDGNTVSLSLGSDVMTANGERVKLVKPPRFIGAVLYVPLRPVAEALGVQVTWDGAQNAVLLTTPIPVPKQVTVATVGELIAAIAPNTSILLKPGRYDFSELDPSSIENPYLYTEDVIYGGGFDVVVRGVKNLTLTGDEDVTLVTPYVYADVLRFEDCGGVTIQNLTAVHDVPHGSCMGDVFELNNCYRVEIVGCQLDGSGTYGIIAVDTRSLTLDNCVISNCTYGAMSLFQTSALTVRDTRVEHCGIYNLVVMLRCETVLFERCDFSENQANSLLNIDSCKNVLFRDCAQQKNQFSEGIYYEGSDRPLLENCIGFQQD